MSTPRYQLDDQAARAAGAVQRGAELRLRCPVHDSSPETLALRQGRLGPVWHCHAGCDPADVRDALLAAGIIRRCDPDAAHTTPRRQDTCKPPTWIARAWRDTEPIADTPAAAYLRTRCLSPPWPAELRWDPRRRRMLARILLGDIMRGLHATILPSRERRTYGPVRGAAVRLAAIDGGLLGIAEGIETALAYNLLTGIPAWAALSSAGVQHAALPDGLKSLAIAADFDGAGLLAAERIERRARDAGIEVHIDLPPRHRTDWADVLAFTASPNASTLATPDVSR